MKLDAHEVWPNIYVGSAPNVNNPLNEFSLLVLCAIEYQPGPNELAFKKPVLRPSFKDNSEPQTVEEAIRIEKVVDAIVLAAPHQKVLVTCIAGLNRSAYVAALAMLRLAPSLSADEIIEMIRSKRTGTMLLGAMPLHNPRFIETLRNARKIK